MRWREGRRSENVEDRRGQRGPMGGGFRLGGGGMILLLIGLWLFGVNPMTLLQIFMGSGGLSTGAPDASYQDRAAPPPDPNDEGSQFVSSVLADTEDTWTEIFASGGERYAPPKLVLFTGAVRSGCGTAQAPDGALLLPGRPEGLHRSRASTTSCRTASARPATSRRRT